jgi:hypothetical protein
MSKIYRTSRGDAVDMDMIRLANESTIAIGNMRTNARGDELGPGGKIVKTRAQIMQEYHKINTPVVTHDDEIRESAPPVNPAPTINPAPTNLLQPLAEDIPVAESASTPNYTKPRGSFAGAVAEQTEVTQELLEPVTSQNATKGIQRI